MVPDYGPVAAGYEDEMLDSRFARLIDHVLDQRPVDHRQHLLGHGLGGRQESGAESCDRKNGFADRSHDVASIVTGSRRPVSVLPKFGRAMAVLGAGNKSRSVGWARGQWLGQSASRLRLYKLSSNSSVREPQLSTSPSA